MTARELFDAVGLVDDALVEEAARPAVRRSAPGRWQRAAVMAACCCLALGVAQASGLDLLGRAADLVMPRMGSAAPPVEKESAVESSAACVTEDNAVPEAAEDGMNDKAFTAGGSTGEADAAALYCPVDTAEYPLWAVYERSGWEDAGLTVNAGMLMVLTDADGAAFAGGQTLTLQSDGPFAAGYAGEGGAPELTAVTEGETTVTLPREGSYYVCVLAGDRDILLTAFEAAE